MKKMKKVILLIAILFSGMLMQANNASEDSTIVLNDFEIAKSIIGKRLVEADNFFIENNIRFAPSTPDGDKYVYLIESSHHGHKNWIFIVNKNSIIIEINLKYVMNRESDIQDLYDYNVTSTKIDVGNKVFHVEKTIGTNSSRLRIK